jgi:hypothetical protein
MAGEFKRYVVECFRQAPLSWRKAAVVMTIVISVGLVAGLWLGWRLEAYPTAYFLLGTGAIAAFDVLAILPYQLYKANAAEIAQLKEQARPKLKCSFSANEPGCVRPNTVITSQSQALGGTVVQGRVKCDYYRIKVEADGIASVADARGHLVSIKRDSTIVCDGENLPLTFAPAEQPDTRAKLICNGQPEYLDLFAITIDNRVLLITKDFAYPSSIQPDKLFSEAGTYIFRVIVSTPATVATSLDVTLTWSGHRQTAKIS